MTGIRSKATSVAVALWLAATLAAGSVVVAPPVSAATIHRDAELLLAKKINKKRVEFGKPSLKEDSFITGQARTHSNNMANGTVSFGHSGFNTRVANIRSNDGGTREVCENVARASGYTDYVEVVRVFNKGWKRSTAGHRECMYSELGWIGNQYGLGLVRSGNNWLGTLIVVRDVTSSN